MTIFEEDEMIEDPPGMVAAQAARASTVENSAISLEIVQNLDKDNREEEADYLTAKAVAVVEVFLLKTAEEEVALTENEIAVAGTFPKTAEEEVALTENEIAVAETFPKTAEEEVVLTAKAVAVVEVLVVEALDEDEAMVQDDFQPTNRERRSREEKIFVEKKILERTDGLSNFHHHHI